MQACMRAWCVLLLFQRSKTSRTIMSREKKWEKSLIQKIVRYFERAGNGKNNNMKIACWFGFQFTLYCWLVSHNENIAQLKKLWKEACGILHFFQASQKACMKALQQTPFFFSGLSWWWWSYSKMFKSWVVIMNRFPFLLFCYGMMAANKLIIYYLIAHLPFRALQLCGIHCTM